MSAALVEQLIGMLLSAIIAHQDTTDEDKIRLAKVLDRLDKLRSHEQDIADGK